MKETDLREVPEAITAVGDSVLLIKFAEYPSSLIKILCAGSSLVNCVLNLKPLPHLKIFLGSPEELR